MKFTTRALRALLIVGSAMVMFASNVQADETAPWRNWQTTLYAGNALVGKIWSTRENGFVTPRKLAKELGDAKFVLIGEVHDNRDHHHLQAWLINQIAKQRRPAVVMEMIKLDRAKKLAAYLAKPDATAAGLGPALEWARSGWPAWPFYQPIAEAALKAAMTILPGDAESTAIRRIARGGLEGVEGKRLGLDQPLPPGLGKALLQDIKDSHCGLLPDAALGPMTQVQRYRDATLAGAMVKGSTSAGAILIAGNGHVRTDRAVPWYLTRKAAGARVSSVMLLEVEEGATTAGDLAVTGPDGKSAADYFWFTPRAQREDQCEKLRKRLGK